MPSLEIPAHPVHRARLAGVMLEETALMAQTGAIVVTGEAAPTAKAPQEVTAEKAGRVGVAIRGAWVVWVVKAEAPSPARGATGDQAAIVAPCQREVEQVEAAGKAVMVARLPAGRVALVEQAALVIPKAHRAELVEMAGVAAAQTLEAVDKEARGAARGVRQALAEVVARPAKQIPVPEARVERAEVVLRTELEVRMAAAVDLPLGHPASRGLGAAVPARYESNIHVRSIARQLSFCRVDVKTLGSAGISGRHLVRFFGTDGRRCAMPRR